MTEHVHEWVLRSGRTKLFNSVIAWCPCGEELSTKEVERHLNATERLSAEEARGLIALLEWMAEAMKKLDLDEGKVGDWNWSCLRAYADALAR